MSRSITIDPVTRIEGHAKVHIEIDDHEKIVSAGMAVRELRGFERILQGMKVEDMPMITARICGICPAAHHLVSAKTLDRVFQVEPPPAGHMLRELLYMGHVIHSHALSLFLLSGPDLILGINADPVKRNIVGVMEADKELAKKGLRLRSVGQKLLAIIGGRGVHPVTATAGGLTLTLSESQCRQLQSYAEEALELTTATADTLKYHLLKFTEQYSGILPTFEEPSYYMGTVKDGKLNFYDGLIRVMNTEGSIVTEFDAMDYADHIIEETLDWSYLKPNFFRDGGNQKHIYRVNTLARINVAEGMETSMAQKELEAFRQNYGRPCHNTLMHHYARLIELIYACEKAVALANDPAIMGEARTLVPNGQTPRGAVAHIEAPRGVLIHEYGVDDRGIVQNANLIIATQQNYAAINNSIRKSAEYFFDKEDNELLNGIEFSIRTYDPCLSCSTHTVGRMPMEIKVYQNNKPFKTIWRS